MRYSLLPINSYMPFRENFCRGLLCWRFHCGLLRGKDVGQNFPQSGSRGTGSMGSSVSNSGDLQAPLPPASHSKAVQAQHTDQIYCFAILVSHGKGYCPVQLNAGKNKRRSRSDVPWGTEGTEAFMVPFTGSITLLATIFSIVFEQC